MSNRDLIKAARQFDRLSILETELLKRLDAFEQEEIRKAERTLKFMARTKEDRVQGIVDWARDKMEREHGGYGVYTKTIDNNKLEIQQS
jgi:hypothetical protein